jgi:hypothetical protein
MRPFERFFPGAEFFEIFEIKTDFWLGYFYGKYVPYKIMGKYVGNFDFYFKRVRSLYGKAQAAIIPRGAHTVKCSLHCVIVSRTHED